MNAEAANLLSEYLRINTTNPPGNEAEAARFFSDLLTQEGISSKKFEPAPGRVSLKAVIPGTGAKKPLILLNHMDVVAADPHHWSFDPFSGDIRDGDIHGRGALDMKSIGIMQLLAFLHLKRNNITPCRDVVFMAVADEETGSQYGAGCLLENNPDEFEAGLVLNEGGFGIQGMAANCPVHMIATAEKGFCWLRLAASGSSGHGSMPHSDNALTHLVLALHRLLSMDTDSFVTPVVAEYFRNLSTAWDFLKPYADDGKDATLLRILKETGIGSMPEIAAMLKNTISLNQLHAGEKTNVIPDRAVADVDVRLLPDTNMDDFVAQMRRCLDDDRIQIAITAAHPPTASPMDTPDFLTLSRILRRHFPESVIAPSLTVGTTDSRFFRQRNIPAYGFCPIVIPMADIKTIHGIDEKISLENLSNATQIYTEVVQALCSKSLF